MLLLKKIINQVENIRILNYFKNWKQLCTNEGLALTALSTPRDSITPFTILQDLEIEKTQPNN